MEFQNRLPKLQKTFPRIPDISVLHWTLIIDDSQIFDILLGWDSDTKDLLPELFDQLDIKIDKSVDLDDKNTRELFNYISENLDEGNMFRNNLVRSLNDKILERLDKINDEEVSKLIDMSHQDYYDKNSLDDLIQRVQWYDKVSAIQHDCVDGKYKLSNELQTKLFQWRNWYVDFLDKNITVKYLDENSSLIWISTNSERNSKLAKVNYRESDKYVESDLYNKLLEIQDKFKDEKMVKLKSELKDW